MQATEISSSEQAAEYALYTADVEAGGRLHNIAGLFSEYQPRDTFTGRVMPEGKFVLFVLSGDDEADIFESLMETLAERIKKQVSSIDKTRGMLAEIVTASLLGNGEPLEDLAALVAMSIINMKTADNTIPRPVTVSGEMADKPFVATWLSVDGIHWRAPEGDLHRGNALAQQVLDLTARQDSIQADDIMSEVANILPARYYIGLTEEEIAARLAADRITNFITITLATGKDRRRQPRLLLDSVLQRFGHPPATRGQSFHDLYREALFYLNYHGQPHIVIMNGEDFAYQTMDVIVDLLEVGYKFCFVAQDEERLIKVMRRHQKLASFLIQLIDDDDEP